MKPLVLVLALAFLIPLPARSAVLERMTLEEMSEQADLVVVGTVISRESRYDDPPRSDRIVSDVVVRVDRVVRGEAHDTVVVTVPGGVVDGKGQIVTGAPVLRPGEEVVLFLRPSFPATSGTVVPSVARRRIVGFSQGLFVVRRDRPNDPPRARQRLSGVLFIGHGEGPETEMDLDLEDLVRTVRGAMPSAHPAAEATTTGRSR